MSGRDGPPTTVATEHGLLVAYGRFAEQIGLQAALETVPFEMKTVEHSPQDKTAELLAHVLAGGMHVHESDHSAHPLVHDPAVAQAWGQAASASGSGVSALRRAVSPETVEAVKAALRHLIDPLRRRVLRDCGRGWLVIDLDRTGLVVGDQATTYAGADFGYMGEVDGPARGDQFARAQSAGLKDTFVLGGSLHPGHPVEIRCLEGLIALIEAEIGRPRRRVELLDGRIPAREGRVREVDAELIRRRRGNLFRRRHTKRGEMEREKLQAQIVQLPAQRDARAAENAANPNPRRIILRRDGGFGHAGKLAGLDEPGDEVVARLPTQRVPERLRHAEGLCGEKVSKNGVLAESRETSLGECPDPLRLFLRRQGWGDQRPERWSRLAVTPSLLAKDWPTRRVGVFSNGRPASAAGTKEGKGIFAGRHLPTRHQPGLAFYQEWVLLAQNLVRWFRRQSLGPTLLMAASIKELVRIGANSRAVVLRRGTAISLTFAGDSPWQGISLTLNGAVTYQPWLPALDDWAAIRT